MNLKKRVSHYPDVLALSLLFVLCGATFLLKIGFNLPAQDEGILLVYPDLILRGFKPYQDFATLYTPGNFYVIAAAFKLLGTSLLTERIVGFIYWLLMVIGIYYLGKSTSPFSGFMAAFAVIAIPNQTVPIAYSVNIAQAMFIAALLFSYLSLKKPSPSIGLMVLSGLVAGASIWFRQDIGIITAFSLFFILFFINRKCLPYFLIGLMVSITPLIILFYHIGFNWVFDCIVLDVIRSIPQRRLPITFTPPLIGLITLIMFNSFAMLVAIRKKFKQEERLLFSGVALYGLAILPTIFQRADNWHIFYVSAPVAGFTVITLAILIKNFFLLRATASTKIILSLLIAGGFLFVFLEKIQRLNYENFQSMSLSHRWIPYNDDDSKEHLQELIQEVRKISSPHQKIFIGPRDLRFTVYNDSYLYFLFPKLIPASRFIEMNPGVANREASGLTEQIKSSDIIILTAGYGNWQDTDPSSLPGSSQPNDIIQDNFVAYKTFKYWQILLPATSALVK